MNDEWNPKGTAHRRYPEGETNPAGWDKLRAQVDRLDDAELALLGLRRIEHVRTKCDPTEDGGWFYEKGKHPEWPDWSHLTEATRGLWLAAAEALEVAAKAAEEETSP